MARPIQFDRVAVLEKAMQTFWERGYCATSMAQLVAATELKPGSLYAAFKSKEGLFLAVLDHYGERSVARIQQALAESGSPLVGVRTYFCKLAEDLEASHARRSCLLVNTVLELARRDETIRERVNGHFTAIEARFLDALKAAQASGELSPDKDPASLAAFLMTSIWGLRVLGGTAPSQKRTQAVVNEILLRLD